MLLRHVKFWIMLVAESMSLLRNSEWKALVVARLYLQLCNDFWFVFFSKIRNLGDNGSESIRRTT